MRWDQIRDLSDPRKQINSTVCLKITNGAILTCLIDLGLLEALILTLLVAMKRPKDYLHFTRADHCLNLSSSARGGRNPLRKWLTEVCEHHRESRTVNRGSRLRAGSPSGRFCFFFTLQTSRLTSTQTSLVNILWCTSSRLMSPKLIYKLNAIPYFYYKHGGVCK